MEQHPIPRQITTFEFKLIGFMTLKQFIYLVVFIPLGFVVYSLFPIPLINILLAIIVAGAGIALAFVPINERSLDVWLKNLIRRLTSPTQFSYHKNNKPLYFLDNLVFTEDPHRVMAHIESRDKLTAYLSQKKVVNTKKQAVHNLFGNMSQQQNPPITQQPISITQSSTNPQGEKIIAKQPFFTGEVKNHKLIPLPGILVYVKDQHGTTVGLMKTNPHGVFATFNQLVPGEYVFELRDPRGTYFFDTMKIQIESINTKPIEFCSKELL